MRRIFVIAAIAISLFSFFYDFLPKNKLEIFFLNVGQADSILIKTPKNHLILIDAGNGEAVLYELNKALSFWQKNFDLVVLTHPDRDHFGGFNSFIKKYKVKNFLMAGVETNDAFYKMLLTKLDEKNINVRFANSNSDFLFDDGALIDILHPSEFLIGENELRNVSSIVLKLELKNIKILFMGDAEKDIEEALIAENQDLKADILKVGHHGSKTSTSEIFLKKVKPEIAIISVGRNNYGHPHQQILELLKKYDIRIYRTDINGTVKLSFKCSDFCAQIP